MREFGWLLVIVGACLLVGSLFVTTSSNMGYSSYSLYSLRMPSEVANLYGMHLQMALIVAGVGSILTGTVAIAADAIIEAINRLKAALPKVSSFPIEPRVAAPLTSPEPEPMPPVATESQEAPSDLETTYEAPNGYEPDRSGAIIVLSIVAVVLLIAVFAYLGESSDQPGITLNTVDVNVENVTTSENRQ